VLKLDPPKKYAGDSSIEKLESWMFDLTEYYWIYSIPLHVQVSTMANFLEGPARHTFINLVAPTMESWTLEKVATLLLDQHFPADLGERLRLCFECATHDSLSVRAWYQRVKTYASHINDVSEEALARQFWRGAQSYLRIAWATE
ncbi:hypothetical protein CPB86DRAFT_684850, partial [Serendipita vermifera]